MAAEGGFEFDREENLPGGSFSKLLLSDEDVVVGPGPYCSSTLFSLDTPKMLCFGDYSVHADEDDENGGGSLITSQTFSSSPVSKSSSNASITSLPKASDSNNKRRNGSSEKNDSGAGDKNGPKKSRAVAGARGSRSGPGHAKAKKREKLGDRVAALQQLVSPYGKTDTASVLHETMGYIKFLQDQVKALCSPYLQRLPPPPPRNGEKEDNKYIQGLKCKGLCLVPMTRIVTNTEATSNGADFWSPVTMNSVNAPATAITDSSMSNK